MRTLVTGAAGFVGSHLCEALRENGHEVLGLDAFVGYYPRELKEGNLASLRDDPSFTFHEADLRSADLDPILDGVDAVINEAAVAGLARSWDDLPTYVSCNILGLARLLEAAERAGVGRFVHISTSSVYGHEAVGPETLPTRPVSPYGITKLAAEQLVTAHTQRSGLPAIILRYFSIYGPRQRPDMAYHRFIEAMSRGEPITVYGDGEQSRSNTFISDCVRGTIQALADGRPGEVYNIGGGGSLTLNRAITLIAQALNVEPTVRFEAPQPGDQRHTRADTSKARRDFRYEPRVTPEIGLWQQVSWQTADRAMSPLPG